MKLTKSRKILLLITGIIVVIILAVVISLNLIIASLIQSEINSALEKNETGYKVSLGGVGGNILFGNIRLKDIHIEPDSNMLAKVRNGEMMPKTAIKADIPLIRIAHVGLMDAIVDKNIIIGSIEIRRASMTILQGKNPMNL